MLVLGMMSGTSLDGIDLALLDTDGEEKITTGASGFFAYQPSDRDILRAALLCADGLPTDILTSRAAWPTPLIAAETLITQRHFEAARDFLSQEKRQPQLIGFHGQTLTHRPDEAMTLQIGDGAALAAQLHIDVIGDFRSADMRAGGQGAPLVPLFHAALIGPLEVPLGVVNLGGIANVTYLSKDGAILAFDTGPANALLDDWMVQNTDHSYDANGALAAQGQVDEAALAALMRHDYFAKAPPKSLDRLDFDLAPVAHLSAADGAATLTAFSAQALAAGLAQCPQQPSRLILCGGGRHNASLCQQISRVSGCAVALCDDMGWAGDALEAQAFAWLAARSLRGLPLSLPQTTGARQPATGGVLFKA